MKNYWTLILLETKLILRSKSFWILAFFSVVCILLPLITLLLGQFILIYQITRDKRANISDILNPLPYCAAKLYLARAVAALLVLFSLWPFMLAVLIFFPEMKLGEWVLVPGAISFLTLKYFVLCLTQVSLVIFFRMFTSHLLLLYCLSIAGWVITSHLASNLGFLPDFFKLFVFGQGFMLPSAPSLAIGYFPLQNIFPGFALAQAGLALLFIVIFIAKQMVRHRESILRSKLIIALFIFSLAAVWFGSHAVFIELDHREQGYRELMQAASAEQAPSANATAILKPESYHLAVKLKTSSHYFDGTAMIKGRISGQPSDKIAFTLRDCFTVTSVSELTTGTPLKWAQNGAALTVYVPKNCQDGQPLTLSISYSGEVWEWFPDRMASPNGPVNFVAAPFSLLRSGYAWYPVPGCHNLYTYRDFINPLTKQKQQTLQAKRISHFPLPFSLTVDIDSDNMIASNLNQTAVETLSGEYKRRYCFYSEAGHDVFLLSGPYERQIIHTADGIVTVYNFPLHNNQTSRVINSLTKIYNFYEDMLQGRTAFKSQQNGTAKYNVIEIPPFLLFSEDGEPRKNLTLTDSIVLSENYFKTDNLTLDFLNKIQTNKRDMAVLQRWWQEDLSEEMGLDGYGDKSIYSSLSYYLYIVGLEKTRAPESYTLARKNIAESYTLAKQNKETGQKQVLIDDFCMPWLPISPVTQEIFPILDTLRTELGEQTLKEVTRNLYHIYTTHGNIHAADFSQTIETALTASSLSPEKQAEIQMHLRNIEQLTAQPGIFKATTSLTQFSFDMEEYLP